MDTPRLSVVLPLGDPRGLAVASVRAWVGQTLPAARYEVVAVDDKREPRRTARARQTLRANDLLIVKALGSEIELYQAGADAARGEFLLFTESHAVPAPQTAEALLEYFDRTGAPAATLRSAHIARGRLARLEARLDEVRGAVIHHGDCAWPTELESALLALGRGRRAYLDAGPSDLIEPYVGAPGPRNRAVLDSRLARELFAALAHSILTARGGARTLGADLAALLRWGPIALAGAAGASLALRVRARLGFLWCSVPWGDSDRHLARHRRTWSRLETCGEIQHLARRALPPLRPARDPLRFVPADADDTDFIGFHYPEKDEGGSFRWTEPAALWRLSLSPGDYRARLRVSRSPADPRLRLYLNGHVVRPVAEFGSPEALTFDLSGGALRPSGEQHLVLLSAPFRPRLSGSTDGRTLGIAVRSLDLVRQGG